MLLITESIAVSRFRMATLERAATLIRTGLLRTKAAHRPAPSLFIYPGLRSQPWWSLKDLPDQTAQGIQSLWAQKDALLAEYDAFRRDALQSDYALQNGENKLHTGAWTWHSAVVKGKLQSAFALAAPITATALAQQSDLLMGVPFAYSFFSSLGSGAAIAPHYGPANLRIRVHIPLRVPSTDRAECGIRVAGETRAWSEPLIFDDCYEHETWNRTSGPDSERVVLLLDLWHPELSTLERDAVQDMFNQAVKAGWIT